MVTFVTSRSLRIVLSEFKSICKHKSVLAFFQVVNRTWVLDVNSTLLTQEGTTEVIHKFEGGSEPWVLCHLSIINLISASIWNIPFLPADQSTDLIHKSLFSVRSIFKSKTGYQQTSWCYRFFNNIIISQHFANRIPVRIRVRIDPLHPLVCHKRRLNGAVLRMRPEKPRSRVTAGVTW
jgi:hypothetical protein